MTTARFAKRAPVATPEKEPPQERFKQIGPDDVTFLRREVGRALGADVRLSPAELQRTYLNAVKTIDELRTSGVLKPRDVDILVGALTALYVQAYVTGTADEFLRRSGMLMHGGVLNRTNLFFGEAFK